MALQEPNYPTTSYARAALCEALLPHVVALAEASATLAQKNPEQMVPENLLLLADGFRRQAISGVLARHGRDGRLLKRVRFDGPMPRIEFTLLLAQLRVALEEFRRRHIHVVDTLRLPAWSLADDPDGSAAARLPPAIMPYTRERAISAALRQQDLDIAEENQWDD